MNVMCGIESSLAAFQAAWRLGRPFTQGIGLRPQPWAGFCRPVGPVLSGTTDELPSVS